MTPYTLRFRPKRQNMFLLPLIWGICFFLTRKGRLSIQKINMEGLKPPYLVLSEHQGFTDYYMAPLSFFPRRVSYVSDMEGFAAFGHWLYGAIGCIPTRRFTRDTSLIHTIYQAIEKNKDIVVVYPEARHSSVGTNSPLYAPVGKLVKYLGIPVVILKSHGSYLDCPVWDEKHRRGAPLSVCLEKVLMPEEIKSRSADEITAVLNEKFRYDEYRWQAENQVRISYPKRAEGLHKVLYVCPNCLTEFEMESKGSMLFCKMCEKQWDMDEYGRMSAKDGLTEFSHIPDWYEFQREKIICEMAQKEYTWEMEVDVEALPNAKGFVPLGKGYVSHSREGFHLFIYDTNQRLFFPSKLLPTLHNEYDYRGRGAGIVLSTKDCCYYLYPPDGKMNVTKIQFAVEYFYKG